jgi:hypothetical protein
MDIMAITITWTSIPSPSHGHHGHHNHMDIMAITITMDFIANVGSDITKMK